MHASNRARFEQSCRNFADRVKMAGRRDPQANIFKLVHDWLCDSKHRWLLVLDNVDDANFLLYSWLSDSDTGQRPLRECLPHCEHGSILVTTRSKVAALRLVEQHNIVSVEPMTEAQALELFDKKLERQKDNSNVVELAAVLNYMPLAIVQAAAYISQRAPRSSVAQYLRSFKKSERKQRYLLNQDETGFRRDREAKNSMAVTLQISFDHIQQTRPSAVDLLSLMSFFDPQEIPEYVLWNLETYRNHEQEERRIVPYKDDDRDYADYGQSGEDDSSSESSFSERFEDDVLVLQDYALISAIAAQRSFKMHSIVQFAVRTWLDAYGKLNRWKEQYIRCLYMDFPTGHFENWAKCQTLFPHVRSAVAQRPEEQDSLKEWAFVLSRAAQYALWRGNVADAETMSRKAMDAKKVSYGPESPEFLDCMLLVGGVYSYGDRWADAEALFEQVTKTSKKVFGTESQRTLVSMTHLGLSYKSQSQWEKAEELEEQIVGIRKSVLGKRHVDTLASMTSLAWIYNKQGRFKKARKLDMQVTIARNRMLDNGRASSTATTDFLAITER
jgi:hypothetical protein